MAFGVDLGTTNSSVAWTDPGGDVYSLRVRRGPKEPFDAVERSLVFDPLGPDIWVGDGAETAADRHPGRHVVASFKRRFDKQRLREMRYQVIRTPTSEYDAVNECIRFSETREMVPLEYDSYTLAEVVGAGAEMFGRLLSTAEIDDPIAGGPTSVKAAVQATDELLYVGVPVSFGPTARRRLLAALVRSGAFGTDADAYQQVIARCRVVYEPLALAATLAPVDEPQHLLVFDYGGGTLDVALLDVKPGVGVSNIVTELALGGVPRAGDALDEAFREGLLADRPRLAEAYRQQVASGDLEDRRRANGAFSFAKVRLSTMEAAVVPLFNEDVTRDDLEAAIGDELDGAVNSVSDVLRKAGMNSADVSGVLLTGGSSLIPAVQDRLRQMFPHLDELTFTAGTPGDIDSEREALTGVSRGLARFGFLERFEATAPSNFWVSVPGGSVATTCLDRGAPDIRELSESPSAAVKIGTRRPVSFGLYSDLVKEAFCGALVDIELDSNVSEVDVRVSASRDRFVPAFGVYARGTGKELAAFDLERMSPQALRDFVEGDSDWLPNHQPHARSAVLIRPLVVGDFVEWRSPGGFRCGKVIRIRDIETNEPVQKMTGFDPSAYVVEVAREEKGVVSLGSLTPATWSNGDVRLL